MSESARVQAWRDAKRQKGLKSCTLWLTADEESLLKDLAAKRRCSPTEIMQQALAYFHTGKPPVTATVTDIEQLRGMIQAEIATLQTASVLATATATVTDTEQLRALIQDELAASALVTATVTAMVTATVPALVRAIVEELALEALGLPATVTCSSEVTETDDSFGMLTGLPPEKAPAQRRGGRPRGEMSQRILTLLTEHAEGLSAEEIRTYLKVSTPIGDTLQGMKRTGVVSVQGQGKGMRYFLARQ